MNNDFFSFVETYREDIMAFFQAFVDFVKALFGKLGGAEGEEETTGE